MTTSEQIRRWRGPALFSYGFRPFFFFGALWAALAMVLWISMLSDRLDLPTRLDPVSWHAHEFLFGYLSAIIAGFLLTAVPNWTGRLPVVGWTLAALFALWMLGRVSFAFSARLPVGIAEIIDLSFLIVLGGMILREIIAGKNWENLVVLALLGVFTLANALFHLEAARGGSAAQGLGLRLGIGAVLMMISLIGGRIVPSFTRNWLVKAGQRDLPSPPMQRFDKATLLMTLLALLLWVFEPTATLSGIALISMALFHLIRLARWKGYRTVPEPLLLALHLGYLFVPLGALSAAFGILRTDILALGSAQHLWMAGAFPLMTLAVMTRATLGHSGQDLHAGARGVMVFACIIVSVLIRVSAGIWPDQSSVLYTASAIFWISAFIGFCAFYGRSLLAPTAPRP